MNTLEKRPAHRVSGGGPKQFVDPRISATDNSASTQKQCQSQRILGTISKGPHATIRVTEQVINGTTYFDVRIFRPFGKSMHRPTPSGLTLRPDAALGVVVAILKAQPDAARAVALAILKDLGMEVRA